MARPKNQWEAEAAQIAERLDRARAAGEQLSLLPGAADEAEGDGKRGRGKGRSMSKLRDLLAARGLRMPEDVLANVAALDDPEGPVMAALKKVEAVSLALFGHAEAPASAKLRMFEMFYTSSIRANDALLPYLHAKVTPDAAPVQATQINVYAGSGAGQGDAGAAKPVEGRVVAPRLAPPPMPHQIQQNQGVAVSAPVNSDGDIRTEPASDWKGTEK